jgi:hypothetical protein
VLVLLLEVRLVRRGKIVVTKISGIKANSADTVKSFQKYPHSQLRYECVSQNIVFEDLPLNIFVAG